MNEVFVETMCFFLLAFLLSVPLTAFTLFLRRRVVIRLHRRDERRKE